MRLLEYIEIENFKTFGSRQRIELDHPAVLIGPNNSGKTSVMQALALWGQAIRTWHEQRGRSGARERAGTPLNRLKILNAPVERTRYFWHETKVRSGNTDIPLTITVGVVHNGKVEPVTLKFRNQGEDLIYCSLDETQRENANLIEHAASINIELLYPMSGLETEEPVLRPERIGVLLGQGQTAQVLRNLCLMVHESSPSDWEKIVGLMHRLFHITIQTPVANARGAIDLIYTQAGVKEPLSLSASGRGLQQMLLIFAYLFSHKRSVLLVDEPDAHLEILRQRQVFVLLRDVASANNSQVILATHSEVILEAALDRNLTLLLGGRADNLAQKARIRESLQRYGTVHYLRARQSGYVLYLEGSTDVDILQRIARHTRHPVAERWDESLNVYHVQSVHADKSVETELQRVEGGFGISARDHFFALRKLLPALRGLAILDNDNRNRTERKDDAFMEYFWERYEIENYFITPQLLLDYVVQRNPDLGLFSIQMDLARDVMSQVVLETIFQGNAKDYAIWQNAEPEAAGLIWQSTTGTLKLSTFAEEFFRRLSVRSGLQMLLRKGEFHELVPLVARDSIPSEVTQKLNLIDNLFRAAAPLD